jgi:hypothetical protein
MSPGMRRYTPEPQGSDLPDGERRQFPPVDAPWTRELGYPLSKFTELLEALFVLLVIARST